MHIGRKVGRMYERDCDYGHQALLGRQEIHTEFWWGIWSVGIPRKTLKDIGLIKMELRETRFDNTAYVTPRTLAD
jgi:hypothetical protein